MGQWLKYGSITRLISDIEENNTINEIKVYNTCIY